MRIFFFVVFFYVHLSSNAQNVFKTFLPAAYDKGSYLKLNVLSLADFGLPTIQPGYEYKLNDRLGFEIAFGIPLRVVGKSHTDSTYYNFYKIRGTLKYYTGKKNGYIGFESFYTHAHYNRYNNTYLLGKYRGRYISDYTVSKKSVVGFDVKAGKSFEIANKLYLENFIGVGMRFVTIKLPENINPREYNTRGFAFQILDVVGLKITPHLTFGLQLVYQL